MKILLACLALILPGAAGAQTVSECDWRASAQAIPEPWEAHSRTFSNGAVRLAVLDTVEPAAGALHLLILSPPYSELGDRQCRVISRDGTMGWAGMYFEDLTASYDPAVGLIFDLPVQIYLPESSFTNSAVLRITLNQASGEIGITQRLGAE